MKKVLVFGIFDGIHKGHISFLRQAKEYGDFLVVCAGQDEVVRKFKNKSPKHTLVERMEMLRGVEYVYQVIPGDKEQSAYSVIKKENPDIICLGYDQRKLGRDLRLWLFKNGLETPVKYLRKGSFMIFSRERSKNF